jgi:REP element-mobilizing transposase RayT
MPDHVHLIFTPLTSYEAMEVCSLAQIMDAIKGASAHMINKALGRRGKVWQTESFDHVLRSSENLDAKIEYVLENPVRRGLSGNSTSYPWIWKKEFHQPFCFELDSRKTAELRSADSRGRLSLHKPFC